MRKLTEVRRNLRDMLNNLHGFRQLPARDGMAGSITFLERELKYVMREYELMTTHRR
jgi:hypothetical protein